MVELFDFVAIIIITVIVLFVVVVYVIYKDIKKAIITKKNDKTCPKKCVKPTTATGSCYHPIKYNTVLKKNQEVRSELICPWSCSSGYSDDPDTCQYDKDCAECSTVSFPNIDSKCPKSKYGCCADMKTERIDEFGNNCIVGCTAGQTGCTGPTESFTNQSNNETGPDISRTLILTEAPDLQIYPACPNIKYPNSNAFNNGYETTKMDNNTPLGTLASWSVITNYNTTEPNLNI